MSNSLTHRVGARASQIRRKSAWRCSLRLHFARGVMSIGQMSKIALSAVNGGPSGGGSSGRRGRCVAIVDFGGISMTSTFFSARLDSLVHVPQRRPEVNLFVADV